MWDEGSEKTVESKGKGVSAVLKETGLLAYENVLLVIGVSLLWSFLLIPGIFILRLPWGGLYVAFISPVALLPLSRFVYLTIRYKRVRYDRFKSEMKHLLRSGAVLGLLASLIFVIVASAWWFYRQDGRMLYFYVAMVQTYLMAVAGLALVYSLPVKAQTMLPVGKVLQTSFRLLFLRPGYALVATIQIVTVGALLLVTTVGFALLFAGLAVLFLTIAVENLIDIYGKGPEEEQA